MEIFTFQDLTSEFSVRCRKKTWQIFPEEFPHLGMIKLNTINTAIKFPL